MSGGRGGLAGAGRVETSEPGKGNGKSVREEAGEAGASEGCMESGACSPAMSLSCASLKVKARVQAGLLPAAIRAPGFRYPSPGKLKKKLGYKQRVMVGAKISSLKIEELEG